MPAMNNPIKALTTASRCFALVTIALAVSFTAAAAKEAVPLRAADGTQAALWQPAPHPRKPYVAQLFGAGAEPLPLLEDSPAGHVHHHALMRWGIAVTGEQTPVDQLDNLAREWIRAAHPATGNQMNQP